MQSGSVSPPIHPSALHRSAIRFGVLAFLALAMGGAYITRQCISVAGTSIQRDLNLNEEQLGLVLAAFGFGYLWLQMVGGWLGKRFGARRMLVLFSVGWSLCSLWAGAAVSMASLMTARIVMGLAQSGLIPVSAQATREWFPPSRRGVASAVMAASMSLGSVVATQLTVMLLKTMGWRDVFSAYTWMGIAWAVFFYLWFRDRPEEHGQVSPQELALIREKPPEVKSEPQTAPGHQVARAALEPERESNSLLLTAMATSSSMWAVCVQAFFRAFGGAFFVTWFPAYLEKSRDFNMEQAGLLTLVPLGGIVIGNLLGGVIVDQLLRATGNRRLSRSGTAVVCHIICAVAILVATTLRDPVLAVWLIGFGALCSGIGSPAAWAATMDISGPHTALIFAIMNTVGNIGGVLSPLIVGKLMQYIKDTQGDWNLVLFLFTGVYLFAALCWAFLNPMRSAVRRGASVLT